MSIAKSITPPEIPCFSVKTTFNANLKESICFSPPFLREISPTSGGAVLRSKLVDERGQVQSPVALVDLAIQS